jgi:hypothetical protein
LIGRRFFDKRVSVTMSAAFIAVAVLAVDTIYSSSSCAEVRHTGPMADGHRPRVQPLAMPRV